MSDLTKKYYADPKPAPWTCKPCGATNAPADFKDPCLRVCGACGQRSGTWNTLAVSVMRRNEDGTVERVGGYDRTYSSMYSTFFPFTQGDREYALISHNYTGTCVIALPSCEHVCGECEWKNFGFCPTGFYVPSTTGDSSEPDDDDPIDGQFGFVCGCVWGDDSSWKVQFLDLRGLAEKRFTRTEKFGYVELPGSAEDLPKYVRVEGPYDDRWSIHIAADQCHGLRLGDGSPLWCVEVNCGVTWNRLRPEGRPSSFVSAEAAWAAAREAYPDVDVETFCRVQETTY